jgi:uncharacterized protein (TIGR02466 family)
MTTEALFVTLLYRAKLAGAGLRALNAELEQACRVIAEDDGAGQDWSAKNGYRGYTSYASLNDLTWRAPAFADLARHLDQHAAAFARDLEFDLGQKRLRLDSLWINILEPGGVHTSHIHPHAALSGTYYVVVPPGASALKLEDPRHAMMMAAPPRKARARQEHKPFVYVAPSAGTVLIWESWLRHEVPMNMADRERISVSFNYAWD